MVDVYCQCGNHFQLGDECAGQQGRCPACRALLAIPGAAGGGEAVSSANRRVIPPASVDLPETAPMDFSPPPVGGLRSAAEAPPRPASGPPAKKESGGATAPP